MKAVQTVGIVLWLSFYGSYVAKALLEKRKGISVSRMGRGVKPAFTRMVEIVLLAVTVGMAAVQLLSVGFYGKWESVTGGGPWTGTGMAAAGTAVCLLGTGVFILAFSHMGDSWRAGIDESQNTRMVTEGIYSVSRNPAFVGFDLFYIGFGLLFPNALQLLFTLLGVFTFHMQIREEEAFMEKRYGESWLRYKKRTGRYFGKGVRG